MAGLNLGASAPGWDQVIKSFRTVPREVKTETTRRGRQLAEPLARELRAEARSQGSHSAKVAGTVESGMKAGVPSVKAGGRLPYTYGAEFGGQHRRTTYYGRSKLGSRYIIIRRRTTMQFRPHRGREGYWFTPTIREGRGREQVLRAWADLVDDVIRNF